MKKYLFYISCLIFFIFPVLLMLFKSVTTPWRSGVTLNWTLRGWEVVFQDSRVIESMWMTLLIALAVALINLLAGVPIAKALSHRSFPLKNTLEAILMLPLFLPIMAAAIGLHITMIRLGLANTWLGVTIVHLVPTIPYSIKVLKAGYDRIPQDMLNQGRMLKAGAWHAFRTIELPMLIPSIRSSIFLAVTISAGQYVLTAIIGGGSVLTMPIIYYPFLQSADDTVMAAFSIAFVLIPAAAILIAEAAASLLAGRFFMKRRSVL
ncbi:ABC transporter permease [Jeotgalibacillus haloalkalitolerans]|uniref:ABC transporter permease subunit n=1 Tax=Jeotgalibacillus haloalkalitolerans TaxID=3104292 RepID=A0ABU5KPR0_9BACL|nr:ABC transporter permease subunit [Jeotgalibacillus sp. HH7-29]MDZ5713170.1 ABC transporter permease subunit [Jeotgalibacillus sp. HH7-29]